MSLAYCFLGGFLKSKFARKSPKESQAKKGRRAQSKSLFAERLRRAARSAVADDVAAAAERMFEQASLFWRNPTPNRAATPPFCCKQYRVSQIFFVCGFIQGDPYSDVICIVLSSLLESYKNVIESSVF